MPKRISKIAKSLKKIGDIQVNDLDFMALLNKDVNEIETEIANSLRRLGNIKVMEWDFNAAMPAVSRVAHTEVDVVGFIKRTAHYKVMEWDFRSALHTTHEPAQKPDEKPSRAEMQMLVSRLENFLQYLINHLIDEPGHAHIQVQEIAPYVLRFKLVLMKRDVSMLIGMEGHTAGAIRRILKAVAGMHGVHALLLILSHEDEITASREDACRT